MLETADACLEGTDHTGYFTCMPQTAPALEECRSGLDDYQRVPKTLYPMKARCRIGCSRCIKGVGWETRLCVCDDWYR